MPGAAANPNRNHCQLRVKPQIFADLRLYSYGNASILKKNLKLPGFCTPSRNCKLMLCPGARGVGTVIVPAFKLLLSAPPIDCVGGCSSVVPNTVTEQGVVAGVPVAAHVAESLTPLTVIVSESSALKSAIDGAGGRVLISTIRKRNRVTFAPVLLTKRRLSVIVPFAPLVTGVRSRTRFGAAVDPMVASTSNAGIDRFSRGAPEFCGLGAPTR